MSLLSPNYVLQPVSEEDLVVASLAWGFTIGFGWLTTWTACKQTMQAYRRQGWKLLRNTYIWMIWSEIIVCFVFSVMCWLHLWGLIPPRLVYAPWIVDFANFMICEVSGSIFPLVNPATNCQLLESSFDNSYILGPSGPIPTPDCYQPFRCYPSGPCTF